MRAEWPAGTWACAHVFSCRSSSEEEVVTMAMDLESIREFVAPLVASLGPRPLRRRAHRRRPRPRGASGRSRPGPREGRWRRPRHDRRRDPRARPGAVRVGDAARQRRPRGQQPRSRADAAAPGALPRRRRDARLGEARPRRRDRPRPRHRSSRPTTTASSSRSRAEDPTTRPGRRLAYADIVACRTVFEWGPAPRPGRGSKPGKGSASRSKGAA